MKSKITKTSIIRLSTRRFSTAIWIFDISLSHIVFFYKTHKCYMNVFNKIELAGQRFSLLFAVFHSLFTVSSSFPLIFICFDWFWLIFIDVINSCFWCFSMITAQPARKSDNILIRFSYMSPTFFILSELWTNRHPTFQFFLWLIRFRYFLDFVLLWKPAWYQHFSYVSHTFLILVSYQVRKSKDS